MAQQEATVEKLMSKTVMTVDLNSNVEDCAKAMSKKGVSCAVITQNGLAIGVVTERDLVSKVLAESVDPKHVLSRDVMSTPLITVGAEASLSEAAGLMAQYRIRRLVVVNAGGALVGIITSGDIARSLAENKGYRDPTFNAMARYAEGGVEGGPYR